MSVMAERMQAAPGAEWSQVRGRLAAPGRGEGSVSSPLDSCGSQAAPDVELSREEKAQLRKEKKQQKKKRREGEKAPTPVPPSEPSPVAPGQPPPPPAPGA